MLMTLLFLHVGILGLQNASTKVDTEEQVLELGPDLKYTLSHK